MDVKRLSVYTGHKISEMTGILMGNATAIELSRRSSKIDVKGHGISYWKDHQQREADFVLKHGTKIIEPIQVACASDKLIIYDKRIRNLIDASKDLRCNKRPVITRDHEAEEKVKGKKIESAHLWKWLLKDIDVL